MIERVITQTSIVVSRDPSGYSVDVATNWIESTLGGGRPMRHYDRYDYLSRDELADLLEHLAHAPVAGEEWRGAGLQLSLI